MSRWVCKEWGSVVLAKTGAGYRLHLENLDWVMSPKSEGVDMAIFGFSTSSATFILDYKDAVRHEHVTTTTKLGVGEVLFGAPTRPGGALVARSGGEPPKDDVCRVVSGGAS